MEMCACVIVYSVVLEKAMDMVLLWVLCCGKHNTRTVLQFLSDKKRTICDRSFEKGNWMANKRSQHRLSEDVPSENVLFWLCSFWS